jgi:DNA-directed RNA polymerase specialized sigma24 family protein
VTPADATCWTLIGAAAGGDAAARGDFARRYEPLARDYFVARWRTSPLRAAVDDAVQEAFVECLKPGGVLNKAAASPPDGFRPYLFGVLRNIARRVEEARGLLPEVPDDHPDDGTGPSKAFEKAWARSLLREAARVQAEMAAGDERATRRVELLRLRFQDVLPIRDIAGRWGEDAAKLHHEYATARDEFRVALARVVAFHTPAATPAQVDAACRDILSALG